MDKSKFYETIRPTFTLTNTNVKGFDYILDQAESRKVLLNDLAYILATTWHETASTMQPIAEYGKGKGKAYGVKGKYSKAPYGRGYVQLTWDANYEKADKELNLKGVLTSDLDKALDPEIAVQILFKGMDEGWFTGKKLRTYIDEADESDTLDLVEFVGARRIINGTDKADLIGKYALTFEKALRASNYLSATSLPEPVETLPVDNLPPAVSTASATETILTLKQADLNTITLAQFLEALNILKGANS